MKIVTPLSCTDYYVPLVESGADEFFCGIVPFEWLDKYNVLMPLNRREYLLDNCNICSMSSIKILQKMVTAYKVKVKVTLNSLFYIKEQYGQVVELIKILKNHGFNTFIIADIALINYLRAKDIRCNIHLSGECGTYNHYTLDFFNQFNISRFIFPGKESIENIHSCIKYNPNNQLEYESFVLNDWCMFIGAYCNTIHCDEMPHTCHLPSQIVRTIPSSSKYKNIYRILNLRNKLSRDNDLKDSMNKKVHYKLSKRRADDYNFAEKGCGLCKLFQLKKAGVTHIKLVGRGHSLEMVKRDLEIIKKSVGLLAKVKSAAEFEQMLKSNLFNNKCPNICFYNADDK